jgi:hypothetical protein
MDAFAYWLEHTTLAYWITQIPWVWPAGETLHFIGMALLIGAVGTVDLRMLGVAKGFPFAPLHQLVRWGIFGFVVNLITGVMFFIGIPTQYVHNQAFFWKMVFIALAGVNVLVFYVTTFHKIEDMGPGEEAPRSAKIIAGTSLFLWAAVMYMGRMLPFLGNAF